MNKFKIVLGKEDEFEAVWKNRETQLQGIKGFKKFNLIKGHTNKEFSIYMSHSEWGTEKNFWDWTKSKSFKLSNKDVASHRNLYLGSPYYEGFKVII